MQKKSLICLKEIILLLHSLTITGKETIQDKIKYVKRFCPAVIEDFSDKDIELAILYTEGEIEVESIEGTNPKKYRASSTEKGI